jgi:hypothetical protein
MQPFPHRYTVDATVQPDQDAQLIMSGVDPIGSAPPIEFGGPSTCPISNSLNCQGELTIDIRVAHE